MTCGSIYFLPAHETNTIDPGILNHPVLILSLDPWCGIADVLIISSLGGKTLDEYAQSHRLRESQIPIFPNKPHPDNGSIVYLNAGSRLPKKSYIKVAVRHAVNQAVLKPLFDQQSQQQLCLSDDSFELIKLMTGFQCRRASRPTSSGSSTPGSSTRRSSNSSCLSPPISPISPKPRLRYSEQELLSLRPCAIRPANIPACFKTEEFDLTKRNVRKEAASSLQSTAPSFYAPLRANEPLRTLRLLASGAGHDHNRNSWGSYLSDAIWAY
ncbi:MAG: hypothetical protein Q9170_006068 [Blastenia crenularia]